MFFKVHSRYSIKDYECNVPHIVISIRDTSPDCRPVYLKPNPHRLDVLKLPFDDTEKTEFARYWGLLVAISEEQAKSIFDFFQDYRNRIEEVFVNCEAGISRSSGTAAALSRICNGEDAEFFKPPYYPNMAVYGSILKAAGYDLKTIIENRQK